MKTITLVIAVSILVGVAGCQDHDVSETYTFSEIIDSVFVNVDFGDIVVTAGNETLVDVGLSCRTAVPRPRVFIEDNTLIVEIEAGNGASACDGVIGITTDRAVSAEITTGAGHVEVREMDGDVEIVTYDGDIELIDLSGDLDLTAVSGDIIGRGLENAPKKITIGAGDVHLSYEEPPTEQPPE